MASGKIEARALATGHSPGMAESKVVRIAKAYGLVFVPQSIKHFHPFGISAVPPNKAARD